MTGRDDAGWVVLGSDLGFTEGPVWTGSELYVASVSRGLVLRLASAMLTRGRPAPSAGEAPADVSVAVETGGGPNGLALRHDGSLWIAQNGIGHRGRNLGAKPGIQRLEVATGVVSTVLGEGLVAPNDLAWGSDGRLWFSDPAGSPIADPPPSCVRALDPSTGRCAVAVDGVLYPNGLAFDPLSGELFVAESATRRIKRYDVAGEVPVALGTFAILDRGQPDGIAFDRRGHLYVATMNGDEVVVLDRGGSVELRLAVPGPAMVTNVCFAGPGLEFLVATAAKGGRVLAMPAPHPGAPLLTSVTTHRVR